MFLSFARFSFLTRQIPILFIMNCGSLPVRPQPVPAENQHLHCLPTILTVSPLSSYHSHCTSYPSHRLSTILTVPLLFSLSPYNFNYLPTILTVSLTCSLSPYHSHCPPYHFHYLPNILTVSLPFSLSPYHSYCPPYHSQ